MQNDFTQIYYSFFVNINSSQNENEMEDISGKAQSFYVNFLNKHDYGDNLMSTTFNFLIEKEIDFNKQDDFISNSSYLGIPKTASLTLHLEYTYFQSCDNKTKYILILNGILFLLNHWNNNLKIPKSNPLGKIIEDFKDLLKANKFLLSEKITSKVFRKLINPFRFYFMQHYFQGIKDKEILFSSDQICTFLNNHLCNVDFGASIKKAYFSFDIFDFNDSSAKNYIDTEKKYKFNTEKVLYFMEQYDSKLFLDKTKYEQVKHLYEGLLVAIQRITYMKKKPKDFNVDKFYNEMKKQMEVYMENYCY